MKRLSTKTLTDPLGVVLLSVICSFIFLSTASAAANWSRYHKDETCSYYYDKGNITYPSKKKKLFGWTTDKDIVGLWVKVIEQDKEPPDQNAEIFKQDEDGVYVEINCLKKNVNVNDVVPSDARKGTVTSSVSISDKKIVENIESGSAKDALVEVICSPR